MRVAFQYQCPYCKSRNIWRQHREFWMRLIPRSRHWMCIKCHRYFLTIGTKRYIKEKG